MEHIKVSFRGFSPKLVAYCFVVISALLLMFHAWTGYRGDEYLTVGSLVLMLTAFILGFCIPRSDKRRFQPAQLAFVVLIIHLFLQKL
jgi:hypothetical protein